jgi:hypothetical protein
MQRLANQFFLLLLLTASVPAHSQIVLTEGTNISVDVSRVDGRIAMDLLGGIWIVPATGGNASRITQDVLPARNPRWSPDGHRLLYQAAAPGQSQIRIIDVASAESEVLSEGQYVDQQAAWHPGGERIVFSSERGDSGFDLWETDLGTRLSWRLSSLPGDETDPAWSGDGRHLAYIHRRAGQWSLMLRRFGEPDQALVVSPQPLYAPSWRPDGSLLTFLQQVADGLILQMVILSDPPVVRTLTTGADFFVAPLTWLDRERFFYAADGAILARTLNDWQSTPVNFRASIDAIDRHSQSPHVHHQLAVTTPSGDRQVIRTARIFDGSAYQYRYAVDVLVADGRIAAVEPRREWPDAILLDLGDATLMPGLIDTYSSLPGGDPRRIGAELLSYGVTCVVSADRPDLDGLMWESAENPGPRLLRAAAVSEKPPDKPKTPVVLAALPQGGAGNLTALRVWQRLGIPIMADSWINGLGLGAELMMGADSLPTSPQGKRYQDIQALTGFGPITLVSGLANATTPGLQALLESRQASRLGTQSLAVRRHTIVPALAGRAAAVVLGSKPDGLPAGLAVHAELLALQAAGLSAADALKSAGLHAAAALRLDGQVGLIAPGALADLVLVSGDPLTRAADALNVIAVVRNGRFYSLGSLLERAEPGPNVE